MNRERFLSLLHLQIRQEQRSGVGYWCAPDLKDALRALYAQPASTPRVAGGPSASRAGIGSAAARAVDIPPRPRAGSDSREPEAAAAQDPVPPPPAQRFARPPAHIAPQASGGARSTPAPSPDAGPAGAPRRAARPVWGAPPTASGRAPDWKRDLEIVEKEAIACTRCELRGGCNSVVFGVGGATVPLVFVGEAPGAEEDRQGIPFVGRAGELLTRIVEAIGLKREQVYICNVIKCRPPGNRDPEPVEVATCSPFLTRQLEILKPKVICTLGRHSTFFLTGESGAMKAMRGAVYEYRGSKVVPTYHPAALLRNPALKPLVWEDVQKVRALLDAE